MVQVRILMLLVLFVVLASGVFALHGFVKDPVYAGLNMHRKGVERVTHFDPRVQNQLYVWQAVAHLEPKSVPLLGRRFGDALYPRGIAKVYSGRYGSEVNSGVQITVDQTLPSKEYDALLEGWLVDEESGYWLSLGVFDTVGRGTGRIELQKLNRYIDVYDAVVVTREPYPDNNPAPSKEVLLKGVIKKTAQVPYKPFSPNATISQRLWGLSSFFYERS